MEGRILSRGAPSYLGKSYPEVQVQKNVRTARRYADARNNMFTIVLSNFTLEARRARRGELLFFYLVQTAGTMEK